MTLSNANADRLLLVLLSKLDLSKISDSSQISSDLLSREMDVVLDHLLADFVHWNSQEKLGAKAQVMDYITTTDQADFAADAKLRLDPPLVRRIIFATLFCIFGLLVILLSPITFLCYLVTKSEPLAEGERIASQYESLCEISDSLSRSLWPDALPPCYCCFSTEHE